MNRILWKSIGLNLMKGSVAAFAATLGMLLSGMAAQALRLPAMQMPAYMDLAHLLPRLFLSWILMAIALGNGFRTLYPVYGQRVLAIGLCNYLLYSALNTLDSLLFMPLPNITTSFFTNALNALLAALVIAALWRPKEAIQPAPGLRSFFAARPPAQWLWRFAVAWLAYAPIYYLLGRVAGAFTQHYYEDPSLNLGLTLPSVSTLLLMQVLRGALFLLAVFPILIGVAGSGKGGSGSRKTLFYWVGGLIFLQISAQTLLQAYWFPWDMRLIHSLELLADSALQAGLYVTLFHVPLTESCQPTLPPAPARSLTPAPPTQGR